MVRPEDVCLDIYRQTRECPEIASLRAEKDMGFEILLGPPYEKPPIAFIGYQPGDWGTTSSEARKKGYEDSWVTKQCQYATESWPLAQRLRKIFPVEFLARCVGLNAIFVRAPNVFEYERAITAAIRRRIREFCIGHVRSILDSIQPIQIVVIGHDTQALFGDSVPCLTSETGRVLVRKGQIFDREVHVVLHLTGAWIRSADRLKIAKYLQALPCA
jgi:hypothetical protein